MKRAAMVVASLVLATTLATAQGPTERVPGYVAIEELGLLDPSTVEVNINLTGAMLKALASSTEGGDSDLALLIHDVSRVRVLVGPPPAGEPAALVATLRTAVDRLEREGWLRLISVREEDDEEVAVLSLESGDLIRGLAVLVLDGEEAVLVNVVGEIRPELMGRLMGSLDSLDAVAAELAEASGVAQ